MYAICTSSYHKNQPKVAKYTIHGSYMGIRTPIPKTSIFCLFFAPLSHEVLLFPQGKREPEVRKPDFDGVFVRSKKAFKEINGILKLLRWRCLFSVFWQILCCFFSRMAYEETHIRCFWAKVVTYRNQQRQQYTTY